MKKGFSINAKGKTEADIYIFEEIGEGWLGGISSKAFADDLKKLSDVKQINLHINSPGGSVFDGIAIYNTLKKHAARVVVDIDGLAASIASIVAMAGDEIRMAENAMMMIHDPWVVTAGTAGELRQTADMMDEVQQLLVKTYARQTSLQDAEIMELMAAETWMGSGQALELGFVDVVTEEIKLAASYNPELLRKYKKAPESLIVKKIIEKPRLAAHKDDRFDAIAFLKERKW